MSYFSFKFYSILRWFSLFPYSSCSFRFSWSALCSAAYSYSLPCKTFSYIFFSFLISAYWFCLYSCCYFYFYSIYLRILFFYYSSIALFLYIYAFSWSSFFFIIYCSLRKFYYNPYTSYSSMIRSWTAPGWPPKLCATCSRSLFIYSWN